LGSPMPDGVYVQFGCGFSAPEGWLNFDVSPTLRFERVPLIGSLYTKNSQRFPARVRYGDIVSGLPLQESSCAGIYGSHVLEHLSLEDFDKALANVFRYLQPSGILRLVVPDLRSLAQQYIASADSEAAFQFMRKSSLGVERRSRGRAGLLRSWLGSSHHLWMWDEPAMAKKLREHGFQKIRRAEFGDSGDPMFSAVEDVGRFTDCLGMQASK
jgi:SAM-dependent methyltransferase